MINFLKQKIYNFLKKSEKWTHTDMVYLAKGGSPLISGKILISISAFLLSLAYANLLPKDVYGTYKYVMSIFGILTLFTLSGIETSLIRSVARGYEGSFSESLKTKIKWGMIGGFISLAVAIYYYLNGDPVLATCFLIVSIFLPFMDSLAIYASFLSGKKLFKASAITSTINQLILASSLIATFFITKNIIIIILVYLCVNTLTRLALLLIIKSKYKTNNKIDNEVISYGKHLSAINIVGSVSAYLDRILLWQFLGPTAVAVYSIALAPASQLTSFLKTIRSLALPKLATGEKEKIKSTLPLKILKFAIILAGPVVLYIVLAKFLFSIFFPKYMEAVIYSQLYFLIILFFPIRLLSNTFAAQAQKKELYITSFLSNTIKIILLLILLPIYGIYGAILSQLITPIFDTFILFYFFRRM